jgi:hypothetical protein
MRKRVMDEGIIAELAPFATGRPDATQSVGTCVPTRSV